MGRWFCQEGWLFKVHASPLLGWLWTPCLYVSCHRHQRLLGLLILDCEPPKPSMGADLLPSLSPLGYVRSSSTEKLTHAPEQKVVVGRWGSRSPQFPKAGSCLLCAPSMSTTVHALMLEWGHMHLLCVSLEASQGMSLPKRTPDSSRGC